MILRPCAHCPKRADCPIKRGMHERCAGIPLTSGTFKCAERWKGFEPGRAVRVTLTDYDVEPEDDSARSRYYKTDPILGTITGHVKGNDGKIIIWLDEPSSRGKIRIRLHPDYPGLKVLDAFRPVCADCGRPEIGAQKPGETWFCDNCGAK